MIVADSKAKEIIEEALETLNLTLPRDTIIIFSPISVREDGEELLLDVFPLWLGYYRHKNLLNNPVKIVVIGCWEEYEHLPYYLSTFNNENIWQRLDKVLMSNTIEYSTIPVESTGKSAVSVFFHGHGKKSVRGVVSRITHYVNVGISHFLSSNDMEETEQNFFKPGEIELEEFKRRLQKYRDIFQFLPWQEELALLDQMINEVGKFLGNPLSFSGHYEKIQQLVLSSYKSVSNLIKVHGISEAKGK
jgi:hypothetical protein